MRIISRVSAISALVILGCFSACTSVLGIEPPKEGTGGPCADFVCESGKCDLKSKAFRTPCGTELECNRNGECKTALLATCVDSFDCATDFCDSGKCRGTLDDDCVIDEECAPGDCIDNKCKLSDTSPCDGPEQCSSGYCIDSICLTRDERPCTVNTDCISGVCAGAVDMKTCKLSAGSTCVDNAQCASAACINGTCAGASCFGLQTKCGTGMDSCCTTLPVPMGNYARNSLLNNTSVSGFFLDRYEVTVERFRQFVDRYPDNKPRVGAGHHPLIPNSGWDSAWDEFLPVTQDALKAALKVCEPTPATTQFPTWTDAPGSNEKMPINCVSWYLAFAFCAWDGGRLPTEAEWEFAADAGEVARLYPWQGVPDASRAVYGCLANGDENVCEFADMQFVGSRSTAGDGKWGHSDLSGSVYEWTLDFSADNYPQPCNDCAQLTPSPFRTRRGGGWSNNPEFITTRVRKNDPPTWQDDVGGVRCAR